MQQSSPQSVHLYSFGYRVGGAPQDMQLVFNLQHLPSPSRYICSKFRGIDAHFQKEFWHLNGVEQVYQDTLTKIITFLKTKQENKTDVTESEVDNVIRIGIGCEIGHHRSVAFVQRLRKDLHTATHLDVLFTHRDLEKYQKLMEERKAQQKLAYSASTSDSDDEPRKSEETRLVKHSRMLRGKGKGNARRFYKHAAPTEVD